MMVWKRVNFCCRSRKQHDETPLPTPTYKYNEWMNDKKKIQYTPRDSDKTGMITRFFAPLGHRSAGLCHGPLSVVRLSVSCLTFSLNIFSETASSEFLEGI